VTAARIVPFAVGFVFALGLGISGMTQPAKIIAFLDITGRWDPSLAFVMGGAVIAFALAYRVSLRRRSPLFAASFPDLPRGRIDRRLLVGAAIFGVGWGLSGVCPGPAFVSLASGAWAPVVFVVAMLAGMWVVRWQAQSA
jgi:uncharacterized membrane protein YedE/YeeE